MLNIAVTHPEKKPHFFTKVWSVLLLSLEQGLYNAVVQN